MREWAIGVLFYPNSPFPGYAEIISIGTPLNLGTTELVLVTDLYAECFR